MEDFNIRLVDLVNWILDVLLPAFFNKLGTFFVADGVSILGFTVAVTIVCIVIGAVLLRV